MRLRVSSDTCVRLFGRVALCALVLGAARTAGAQTTVTIREQSQVVHATLRAGSYANTNISDVLETRAAASGSDYLRRSLLKFDTENAIPAGSNVTSALLTLTVKNGSEDATRRIAAYQVRTAWTEGESTWNYRRENDRWTTAGGDLGTLLSTVTVSNVAGSRATFDVTALVKAAVTGGLGASRYTRLALVDLDSAGSASYRAFFLPTDTDPGRRPTLQVTYGGTVAPPTPPTTSTPPPPPPSAPTGSILRVLHWNTHHGGVGTDGKKDAARFISWVVKMNPDIISFNEVERYSSSDDDAKLFQTLIQQKTGKTWYYRFSPGPGGTTGIGNMILSRYPFAATDVQSLSAQRGVVNAMINVNGRVVNFFSTHLDDASASRRLNEIAQLKSWSAGMAEQRIVAGDFNAWPGSTENAKMKETHRDSWATAQSDGTAIAYPGNTAGNTRNSRIDYIYYSSAASRLVLKSSQVYDTRDANGVMPSDHRPLLSIFEIQ
jgi:endonuclease/exonuclease/phosphatase family metal-dependent hydrolase